MLKSSRKNLKGKDARIAVVTSRFNEFITKALLKGCISQLKKCGVKSKNIRIVWVPGSFELPVTALKIAQKKNMDAVICLGAVIRGETYHYELVAQEVARGIMKVSLMSGKPIIFGVLATETVDQAYKRSQEKGDNKGFDAALSALDMIDVMKNLTRKQNA